MIFTFKIDDDLELAYPQMGDAAELHQLAVENLEYLKPWMPWAKDDYSLEATKDFIRRNLQAVADQTGFLAIIVYRKKIAGLIDFHAIDASIRSADIGYWISKDLEGKGIITRCAKSFIEYGFNELQLNRIQINCNTANSRSRAIPERLGFKLEGILRQTEAFEDGLRDLAVYSILKEEWK